MWVYNEQFSATMSLLYDFLIPCSHAALRASIAAFNTCLQIKLCFIFFSVSCLSGHTGRFIKTVFCTSLLFVLAHICFQTVLYTYAPLNTAIGYNCSQWETITRHIGLSRLPLEDPWNVLRLLCPDVGVCVVSLVTIVLCSRLLEEESADTTTENEEEEESSVDEEVEEEERSSNGDPDEVSTATRAKQRAEGLKVKVLKILRDLGRVTVVVLLGLAGITLPSAFSALYFLLFIGVCTWWACHLPISHLGFNALCVMVGFFAAGHLVCLYLYQSLLGQGLFPPHSLWARLFGLKDIIIPGNCSTPDDLILNPSHDWPVYVNPGILLVLYVTVAAVIKSGLHEKRKASAEELVELKSWNQPKDDCEDETQVAAAASLSATLIRKSIHTRSSSPQPDRPDAPCSLVAGVAVAPGGQLSESPFFLLGRVVMQQSYVCALIAMMVWSITYHSWLTFVLLLWACLIWMLRSRRHAATLCSPFILLYGLALCCLQYVWAMELESILPTKVGTMSLRQLGLDRAQYPCLRLGAMLLFTLTFWLLVRQSVKENFRRKSKMSTPLQEVTTKELGAGSESVLKVLGGMVMSCYAKYWIYVCGGMFIMVSFAGKLVAYKIVYMLLFLLCLCLYQATGLFLTCVCGEYAVADFQMALCPAVLINIRQIRGVINNHLIVLMLLVFEATVYRHQAHHYRQLLRSPPAILTLFPSAKRDTLDNGLVPCLKYLLNYAFYKFGLEICFLMTVNVIGQRMNFLVIIHGCWMVALLVRRRRAAIAKIWPKYCLFLSIFMIYQYLLCVGIPPALCIDYPWRWNNQLLMSSALIKWIYLPDFYTVPNSKNLMADFLLLMCASQQWKVFECEKQEEWMVQAGENTDEPDPMEGQLFNPAPNFINCRSYLDMVKVLVFRYFFWFVLSMVFITGATRISVFGLGYLIASFFFLLFGTKLLVKPSRVRLMLWDCLIIYNVAVIISKNALSILACVFVSEMQARFCWVIQLFSLVCTVKGYYDPAAVSGDTCSLPVEEAGILWDSLCLLCLLLQRRVFLSFYFLHVTTELQAFAKQASRGFELFRASIMKNVKFHQQIEKKSLSQLKKSNWYQPWIDHAGVIHSGDYYLFESDSEDEEDLNYEEKKPQAQTACQLAYQAWVTSVKAALRDRQRRQGHMKAVKRKESKKAERGDEVFEEADDNCEVEEPEEEESVHGEMVQKILDILRFLWAIILAMVDGVTQWLNLLTKQYRDTSTVLCNERYFIIHKIKQVSESREDLVSQNSESSSRNTSLDPEQAARSRSTMRCCDVWSWCSAVCLLRAFFIEELEQSREFFNNQNRLLRLLVAVFNLLSANSELLCYFIMVLNNVVSASVISLVLPMLVFLWAMLSAPRPTKSFWMTAIVYTEAMVVLKYIFQFGFFPWNSVYEMTLNEDKPFFPPRIFGLEKTDSYIKYDLLQLLALFFHRSLLMQYGLWDHEGPLEEQCVSSEDGHNVTAGEENGSRKEEAQDAKRKDQVISVESILTDSEHQMCCVFLCRFQNVKQPAQSFFRSITKDKYRASTDVYALMFLTDVVDFVIIIFGFWAFGKHSAAADIASTLSEDQVPEAFLVMLLIQFSTMIIDRALYLRKAVLGKLIFQVILVLGIHLWMFFILPAVTERMFNQNFVAQLWYFVKCIYFGLSAYQIRCGYPTRILGNFLTKKYNHLNLFLFQGYGNIATIATVIVSTVHVTL
uniref:Piezo type mechanosensitive ion channel component 1 (Er blood group) n=1 Tax=Xiphophorus couchianus TaxID=32473 RepID=A0A3B5M5Z8_9TELE